VNIVDDYDLILYEEGDARFYDIYYQDAWLGSWDTSDVIANLTYKGNPVGIGLPAVQPYASIQVSSRFNVIEVPFEEGYEFNFTYKMPSGCKLYKEKIGSSSLKSVSSVAKAKNNGLEKSYSELFLLYPNPTKDFIYISINNYDSDLSAEVSIYDMNGKLVYSEEINKPTTKINVHSWDSGTYLILVKYADRYERKKVIKQ
jgi:hypothetical protein